MIINTAEYIASYPKLEMCPQADRPEYAFIGRSNVGKSSLINMLTGRKALARTSAQPGKTQYMNYFDINGEWYLVDLPGYGYAKTPKHLRDSWKKMIDNYLVNRITLQCAFLLIDSSVPPQQKDINFANWMGEQQIPFVIAFTKNDRKKAQKNNYIQEFKSALLEYWETFPQYFVTSAQDKSGRAEILSFLEEVNSQFELPPSTDNW